MAAGTGEDSIQLSSGHHMPLVGLGCWQLQGSDAVEVALDAGYRLVDTAYTYQNEAEVGENIRRWVNKGAGRREDVFVTTKLPMIGMSAEGVKKFLRKSLDLLGLDYVDLYLVHTSVGMTGSHDNDVVPVDENNQARMDYSTDLIAIWKAMEEAVDAGLARSIGVSNYSVKQIRKTLAVARIPPAVHQIELHVHYQQPAMTRFCRENNIALTSFGSLGSPGRGNLSITYANQMFLMDHPVVRLVADNHKVKPSQVLLRFWVQQKVVVIPKSNNPERIVLNREVLNWNLTELEMRALASLDLGAKGKSFLVPEDSLIRLHPEYSD